jgi:hypothetical protein
MGDLLSNGLGNIFSSLLGEGIEKTGDLRNNRWVRGVCLVLMFLISAGLALASALLWTSARYPNATGLWQWVQQGGPAWVLTVPALAALTFLLLLVPVPGKFTPIAFCATATFGCTLGALIVFQGGGKTAIAPVAIASGVAALVLPIIGLMLAMGDVPPLTAPLARFALPYWGRRRHLLALRAWGHDHGWRGVLPGGAITTLSMQGPYDATHPVVVTSGADFHMTQGGSFVFTLSAKMTSPYDIVAFRISADPPPEQARSRVAAGTLRAGLSRTIHYYVVPASDHPLPAGFMERLGAIVEAGRQYFGKLDFAHATPFGLRYTHKSGRRLTAREGNLDPLLSWMFSLCTLLEEVSPRPANAAESAPGSHGGSGDGGDSAAPGQ